MKIIRIIIPALLLVACSKENNTANNNDSLKKQLLVQLKNSYTNEEWFVPAHIAAGELTGEQAAWHDSTDNHSIGQLVSHLAFWNGRVLSSFKGNKPPDFNDDNAITFKQLNENEWRDMTVKLDSIQKEIEVAVEAATPEQIAEWQPTINNLCMHNAYHTGQIMYIRKRNGWWKR